MEIEVFFRVLNILLILVLFVYLFRLKDWWASKPVEERLLLVCLPLMFLAALYSSGEALVQDLGFGTRVLFNTPIIVLGIYSSWKLLKKVRQYTSRREEDYDDH